jgi:hypothetical protein
VNEGSIQKIIRSVGTTCADARAKYVAVQDDLPEGWSISNTLSIIGLGPKSASPAFDPEVAKEMFAKLYVFTSFTVIQTNAGADLAMKQLYFLQLMTSRLPISCSASISSPCQLRRAWKPLLAAFYHSPHMYFNMHMHLRAQPSTPISTSLFYDS